MTLLSIDARANHYLRSHIFIGLKLGLIQYLLKKSIQKLYLDSCQTCEQFVIEWVCILIKWHVREAIVRKIKDFLWNNFENGSRGGSEWFHTSIYFVQTPLKHHATPFKYPSKSPIFSLKMDGTKINRDFIKGGQGRGLHFIKWFHTKSLIYGRWLPYEYIWRAGERPKLTFLFFLGVKGQN